MHGRRLFELWSEVERLARLARRVAKSDPRVYAMLTEAVDVPDDVEPDPAKLQAAKDAFYRMNPLHLSIALGGWAPQPRREPSRHVHASFDTTSVVRVLEVFPERPGRAALAVQAFETRDDHSPVRVTIAEGTTLPEVNAALANVLETLAAEWWRLIGQRAEPCFRCRVEQRERQTRNKKGGSSKGLSVPTPASKRNARARESMAAA